jgi:hypothetical protein
LQKINNQGRWNIERKHEHNCAEYH